MKRTPYQGALHQRSVSSLTPVDIGRYFKSRYSGEDVNNPFAKVGIVNACVKRSADAIASMPLRISTLDDEVVETGPLVMLAERPNPRMTRRAFWRALRAYVLLFGRAYIVKQLAGRQVVGYTVRSELEISENRNAVTSEVDFYRYRPIGAPGAGEQTLTTDEVHPVIDPDFGCGDLNRPMSPRQAVAIAIRQHYKADIANDASLDHGASGGLGLKTTGNLSKPQKDELEESLLQRHAGVRNRHKWMLLEGGLSVEKLFNTFAEMEFAELKNMTREDIAVGFGWNTIALGYQPDGGLGSGQTLEAAHLIVWTDQHLPTAEWFAEEWCEAIVTPFDSDRSLTVRDATRRKMRRAERCSRTMRNLKARAAALNQKFFAWFDSSGIPVLQKAGLELAKQASEWIDKGVPLNHVLSAYDLPFEEVAWGNTWHKPIGLHDVQADDGAPGDDDEPGFTPPPDSPDSPDAPDDDQADNEDDGDVKAASIRANVVLRELSEAALTNLWRQWRTSWAGLERTVRRKVKGHFSRLRAQTLKRLDEVMGGVKSIAPDQQRDLIGRILFDLVEENGKLIAGVSPLIRESLRLGGQQSMDEAAIAEGAEEPNLFNINDPEVGHAVRRRKVKISGINKTLQSRLRSQLAAGIGENETTAQLADRIRKEFNLAASRAKTIAMTETGAAVEDARQIGRKQAGVPSKSWLWSRKETGRPWHGETERITMADPVPNDQRFVLAQTGARTLHPRGDGLSAADAANCGCTTLARYPDDQVKDLRVIRTIKTRGFTTYDQLMKRAA